MKWDEYEKKIWKKCKDDSRTEAFTRKYIDYAKKLYDKDLPVISSPSHFSMLVGMNHGYVCSMARVPSKFYREFEIKKSNGKNRLISEPLPDLKFVQHFCKRKNIKSQRQISPFTNCCCHDGYKGFFS